MNAAITKGYFKEKTTRNEITKFNDIQENIY